MTTKMKCEYPGCEAEYQTVDAAFGLVCGLHRDMPQIPVELRDTGKRAHPVQVMTDEQVDQEIGDFARAIAAKQGDVWKLQREAAAWKALCEHVAYDHAGMGYETLRELRKQWGLE